MIRSIYIMIIVCGLFISVLSLSVACAGTVGNPSSPDVPGGPGAFSLKRSNNIMVKTGVELELLFDKDLGSEFDSGVELTSGEWYMARFSTVIFERYEPYIKLGIAHMKARWDENNQEAKIESENAFAWALGAKALIYEFQRPTIKILGDAYYRMADLDVAEFHLGGTKQEINSSRSRFLIREWQIALIAAGEIDITSSTQDEVLGISTLVPYGGIKYSDCNGRLRGYLSSTIFYTPGELDGDNNIGIFAGCDLVGPHSVLINVEGRFVDELGATLGLLLLF